MVIASALIPDNDAGRLGSVFGPVPTVGGREPTQVA
jgi:hypothetical protein